MDKKNIQQAYDSIYPDWEQRERMLSNITNRQEENKMESNRYSAKPQKAIGWKLVPVAAAFALILCGAGALALGGQNTNKEMYDASVSQSGNELAQTGQVSIEIPEETEELDQKMGGELKQFTTDYSSVFSCYNRAISENWDFETCEANGISYMVGYLDNLDGMGYAEIDLDGDSIKELIISDGNVIYDLYCFTNDKPCSVLSGGERNSYRLCENHVIANIGSNSAASTDYNFYCLKKGELVCVNSVKFDAEGTADTDWYHCHPDGNIHLPNHHKDHHSEHHDSVTPISEQQAMDIIDGYKFADLELKPIPGMG